MSDGAPKAATGLHDLTACQMLAQLGLPPEGSSATWQEVVAWGGLPPGTRVAPPRPIFPRLELDPTRPD